MLRIGGQPTPHLLGSGSAASPSYSFAANPTTGIYLSGNSITFSRLGTDRFQFGVGILNLISGTGGLLFNSEFSLGREAANVLAQFNGTNPQTHRIYNTLNGADFERFSISYNAGNSGYYLEGEAGGTGVARRIFFRIGGTFSARFDAGSLGVPNLFLTNASLTNQGLFTSLSDGVIRITNAAASDFGRLMFGGSSASFPSLRRAGTTLEFRLADDSGYSNAVALNFISNSTVRMGQSAATLANGAGVAAGTLANAPAAGNPTKWAAYDDNGTVRYIPMW